MPADAWIPLAACEVAFLFALTLVSRWWRSRRPYLASWAISLSLFTLGAGALWYGSAFGWHAAAFRVYYVCGATLDVPWLAMGQIQLMSRRRWVELARLGLVLFSVVATFVVGFEPLRAPVTGHTLPNGQLIYPALALTLIGISNAVGATIVIVGALVSAVRQWGAGAAGRARAKGVLLVALGVAAAGAGGTLTFLGATAANATGVLVGVCLIYLGFRRTSARVGRHRGLGHPPPGLGAAS